MFGLFSLDMLKKIFEYGMKTVKKLFGSSRHEVLNLNVVHDGEFVYTSQREEWIGAGDLFGFHSLIRTSK